MITRRAFTLIEALVIMALISVLIGILLPALGAWRRGARCMQSSTQGRGIHSGLVLFSQGNNTYYPGIDKDGNRLEDYTTEFRFQELLDDNYFTGEYIISPSETKSAWTQGPVTSAMYSYALLNISDLNSPRMAEWKDSSNAEAVVLTDRAIGMDDEGHIRSVHTNPSDKTRSEWRGSVAWNDNRVTFESTYELTTQYGMTTTTCDNLFNTSNGSLVFSGIDLIIDVDTKKQP